MAFSQCHVSLLVLTVFSSAIFVSSADNVPVFIWGDIEEGASRKFNPLQSLSTEDFDAILKEELNDKNVVVVFAEENLSVEDLKVRNSDGLSAYKYLHNQLQDSLYLPSVASPLDTLDNQEGFQSADRVKLTDKILVADVKTNGKVLIINLEDAQNGESRFDMLKRHDEFMAELVEKLSEKEEGVVAIYTARHPSWFIPEAHSRSKRQADGTGDTHNWQMDNVLLYALSAKATLNGAVTEMGNASNAVQTPGNDGTYDVTITFPNGTATLNIMKEADSWSIKTLTYDTNVMRASEIYARENFSYSCNSDLTFYGANGSFTFDDTFQIQAWFNASSKASFDDAHYCSGFFSVPIFSGLFIVALLLIITFYGTCMMMDIRTNDRYDDPKGKTITINAGE